MDLEAIKNHLANYKEETLQISGNGIWWKNQQAYSHILPFQDRYKNIIDKGFAEELKGLIQKDSLHLGFSHLNSSQALALNLFGPLVIKNKLSLIPQIPDLVDNKGLFEYIEFANEGTNFDFYIQNQSHNQKFYFEVKYTEKEFGKAKKDVSHHQKYSDFYESRLREIVQLTEDEFYKEYQLWRNIIYAKNGYVFFVLPKFRDDLKNKVEEAKEKITNEDVKNHINVLTIESIVSNCQKNNELKEHYMEFKKKYFLDSL